MANQFEQLGNIFKNKPARKKPPAYQWQDLALRIIQELHIPNFKRSSVFKICKNYSQEKVEQALNDTKELCPSGQSWKYFFKIIGNQGQENYKKD